MRLGRGKREPLEQVTLPERSDVVTLISVSGKQIPAKVVECGANTLVVLIVLLSDQLSASQLDGLTVEFPSPRGLVRLGGTVTAEDRDLIRFSELYSAEVLQQREFVRVKANRPVLVYLAKDRMPVQSFAVDLSGGGLLLAGPDMLEIGDTVEFQLTLAPGSTPIAGSGTVVRSDIKGHRGIAFTEMSNVHRRQLVRFIFECERAERRRMLEVNKRDGN